MEKKVCANCLHKNVCGRMTLISSDNFCKDAWIPDADKEAQLAAIIRLKPTVQVDAFGNYETVFIPDKHGKYVKYTDAQELIA